MAGIKPEHIKSTEDLARIPILTKKELRERFWDFLPMELPPCRVSRTSGSTGIPVCLLSDEPSRIFNSAAVIRYRQALGLGLSVRPILTPLKTPDEPKFKKAQWTFLQGVHKTYYINPYIESPDNVDYARFLGRKLRKPAIIGITPAIRILAFKIRDGILPPIYPSIIMPMGESLMPEVRELIESTFKAKVADIYACNEAGDIAWQCLAANNYHINADNVIVEIVIDNKPAQIGQVGEVVITNLNRYSMPIIRYKNGDLAGLSPESDECKCGCRLPMMAEIIGRTGQDISLPDGKAVPWNQLKSLMNHPQIRQFQLVQNAEGNLAVKYSSEPTADIQNLERFVNGRFRNLLGDSIGIIMQQVHEIPPDPSGKSKLVISHYKPAI